MSKTLDDIFTLTDRLVYLKTFLGILQKAVFVDGLNPVEAEIIKIEIKNLEDSITYLDSYKEWTFSFQGGGWNSVLAKTKEDAIIKAFDSGYLGAIETSFRLSKESDNKHLLSLFY